MRQRWVGAVALVPLCAYLLTWVVATVIMSQRAPLGSVRATDLAVYAGAGRVVRDGGNPYDGNAVWASAYPLIDPGRRQPPKVNNVRVAEPPVLVWAMQPLADLPFPVTARLAELASLLVVVLGLAAVVVSLGVPRPLLALLIAVAMPPGVQYIYYGNIGVLVFAALGAGLALARRFPFLAGIALAMTICKPQVALPLAGLVILFHTPNRSRAIWGFITGAALLLLSSAAVMGPRSLLWWAQGFRSFSGTISHQIQIPSLSGLYLGRVPAGVSLLLTGTLILMALMATITAWWRLRGSTPVSVRSLAWLWLLWFLVTPYSHYYDYLFLAPVFASCFVARGQAERLRAIALLYGVVLVGLQPGAYPAEPLVAHLVPVAALLWLLPWQRLRSQWASESLSVQGPDDVGPARHLLRGPS